MTELRVKAAAKTPRRNDGEPPAKRARYLFNFESVTQTETASVL